MNIDPNDFLQVLKNLKNAASAIPQLKRVFDDMVGFIGDRVHHEREKRNFLYVTRLATLKAKAKLERTGGKLTAFSFKDGRRLFEASADEDREELQALWASILAKLMTGETRTIRPEWLHFVGKLEPLDALVLLHFDDVRPSLVSRERQVSSIHYALKRLQGAEEISFAEVDLTLKHLEEIGFLVFEMRRLHNSSGGITEDTGFYKTSLGKHILDLVSDDKKEASPSPASS
ncbi:hypothetical protein AA105894_2707 [Asaia spathodeae NBRC 105894]|nr:hypothetical protein AA105894_2707 [Asaia spathodeae NBRC 105894]